MDQVFGIPDFARIFLPDTPLLEIFLRGTATYLSIFILLRLVLKREAGTINIADLLVVVLLADAAQNAMADDYTSITDGLLLITTIIFWAYALDWLGYHFPSLQRLVNPPALPLIKDGRLLRHNMRRELLTEDELMSLLRENGIEDPAEVKLAYLEGSGRFSVIPRHTGRDSS
ncbi:MAG: DUF421 domain-containing protein [Herpetosiphonaceae bacterium]|nr:MAG: DUF421 domain-containing protein [Herpetosiphonaceae bacterium]